MKILDLLQEKLEIDDKDMQEFEEIIGDVKGIVDENQIQFSPNPEIAFYAHIVNYVNRLKTQEALTMKFEEYRKEIDQDIYLIAEQIVQQICFRFGCQLDMSEVLLVAIHIQATLV